MSEILLRNRKVPKLPAAVKSEILELYTWPLLEKKASEALHSRVIDLLPNWWEHFWLFTPTKGLKSNESFMLRMKFKIKKEQRKHNSRPPKYSRYSEELRIHEAIRHCRRLFPDLPNEVEEAKAARKRHKNYVRQIRHREKGKEYKITDHDLDHGLSKLEQRREKNLITLKACKRSRFPIMALRDPAKLAWTKYAYEAAVLEIGSMASTNRVTRAMLKHLNPQYKICAKTSRRWRESLAKIEKDGVLWTHLV